jgi:serine/threonine protein kinase
VLDFGIAKIEEPGRDDWTHSQALLASPAYASPEQLRASKDADARADIWSLGVILYQCLAGALPFEGSTLAVVSSRILRDAPIPLRRRASNLPAGLEPIVDRCLQKSPGDRFPDADALVEALAPFAPGAAHDCLARIRSLGPPRHESPPAKTRERSTAGDDTVTHPSFERRERPSEPEQRLRRIGKRAFLVSLAIVLLGATTVLARRSHTSTIPSRTESAPPQIAVTPTPLAAKAIADVPQPAIELPQQRVGSSSGGARRVLPVKRRPPPPASNTNTPNAAPSGTDVLPLDQLPLNDLIDGRK